MPLGLVMFADGSLALGHFAVFRATPSSCVMRVCGLAGRRGLLSARRGVCLLRVLFRRVLYVYTNYYTPAIAPAFCEKGGGCSCVFVFIHACDRMSFGSTPSARASVASLFPQEAQRTLRAKACRRQPTERLCCGRVSSSPPVSTFDVPTNMM